MRGPQELENTFAPCKAVSPCSSNRHSTMIDEIIAGDEGGCGGRGGEKLKSSQKIAGLGDRQSESKERIFF